MIFSLILLFLGVIVIPWQQSSSGQGTVVPYHPNERLQNINAPVKGVVQHWHVFEGAVVSKGDVLAEIIDLDPLLLSRLDQQRQATRVALEASRQALETSRRNLGRQQGLSEKGLKSQREFELAKLEVNKFESEVAVKEKELVEIESKLSRQATQQVTAPRDGKVVRIFFPQGGAVIKEGDTLATLAPSTEDLVVEVLIDGNDLPLMRVGRPTRLQFEGWPAIQFSGWPSVALGTFGGRVLNIDPSDNGDGKFRIFVEPDALDEPWPSAPLLRQGVRVKAWVLLDTVPLWFELWRQFNGFPPVVSSGKEDGDKGSDKGDKGNPVAKKAKKK
jgi:multidrug efflux pump subunit AcrA (membrane-fusion protein)